MTRLLLRLLFWLSCGRPMRCCGVQFVDKVSGHEVRLYVDHFGRPWLAEHRWSLFRVPASQ